MNYVKIVKGMVGTDLQCKGQPRQGQSPNYHHKIAFNTPANGEDGQPGKIHVDCFQPRAIIQAQLLQDKSRAQRLFVLLRRSSVLMKVSGKTLQLRTLTKEGKLSKGKDKSGWTGVTMNMIGL